MKTKQTKIKKVDMRLKKNRMAFDGLNEDGTPIKKSQAISTRLPEVIVEYDFRKDGVIERRQKHFADAHRAKRFYIKKESLDKNPTLRKVEEQKAITPPVKVEPKKPEITFKTVVESEVCDDKVTIKVMLDDGSYFITHKLLEVGEYGKKGHHFTLPPVNDRVAKHLVTFLCGMKKGAYNRLKTQLARIAERQSKMRNKAERKRPIVGPNTPTKTIVDIKFDKKFRSLVVKLNDGTEFTSDRLKVYNDREHPDHRITDWGAFGGTFFNGLSKAKFAELQRRNLMLIEKQQAAAEVVMAKELSTWKKAVQMSWNKAFTRFTVTLEDGKSLRSDKVEMVHIDTQYKDGEVDRKWARNLKKNTGKYFLVFNGQPVWDFIPDKTWAFFKKRNTQYVKRTAEQREEEAKIAQQLDVARKQVVEKLKGEKPVKQPKAPKSAKIDKAKDAFGNPADSGCGKINAAIFKIGAGKLFQVADIDKVVKPLGINHASSHLRTLTQKGYLIKTDKGFKMKPIAGAKVEEPKITLESATKLVKESTAAVDKVRGKKAPRKSYRLEIGKGHKPSNKRQPKAAAKPVKGVKTATATKSPKTTTSKARSTPAKKGKKAK
jgi:hypothetical protein